MYSIKNVKTFRGMEGQGFNADLYKDGKKIAFVMDSAQGGCLDFEWIDRKEEKIINDYAKTLPKSKTFGIEIEMDADIIIDNLVNDYLLDKEYKRKCKNNVVFKTKEDEEGSYNVVKAEYNPDIKKRLMEKYPTITEFINERYL